MKLYSKKLDSLAALELEKKRVEKELSQLEKEDLFSMDTILAQKNKMADAGGNMLSSLLERIPVLGASPFVGMAVQMIQKRFMQPSERKEEKPRKQQVEADLAAVSENKKKKDKKDKPSKNIVKTVAMEILVGYLKWKAIELSYKGVRYVIKKRKEKRQEQES